MPSYNKRAAAFFPSGLLIFLVAISALYLARSILIPLALALLIAFVLTPAVSRLESWAVPRIASVLLVIVISCSAILTLGWFMSRQLLDTVEKMPLYKANIDRKLQSVQSRGSHLSGVVATFQQLGQSLESHRENKPPNLSGERPEDPRPVRIVTTSSGFQAIRDFVGPILVPLEQAFLVLIFTLFILLDREELRNRLVKLLGQQQMTTTTEAMNDAATRITKYVAMQAVINTSFGLVVGLALYVAGVSSPLLWGVLAAFLRFVPYAGPLIAGALPFAVAVATTEGWTTPVAVAGIFLVAELVTGNFVEPFVLGTHTGLSSIAILVSAVFWALVWGPVGLILSTPLTVCLSVLGRYAPQLEFLHVILGDEPALALEVLFYQRVLAVDHAGAFNVLEGELKSRTLVQIYDEIVIPALVMAKSDFRTGALDQTKHNFVVENISETVSELAELSPASSPVNTVTPSVSRRSGRVFAVPAVDVTDETIAAMFTQIAEQCGFPGMALPVTDSPVLLLEGLSPASKDLICISAAPPLALKKARQLSREIHGAFPDVPIVVGLWNSPRSSSRNWDRLKGTFAGNVVTTLTETQATLSSNGIPVAL